MADVHSKQVRSFNMSRIRSVNTKPEITVRKGLFAAGLRFRLHDKKLPGKPDIVLRKYKTVVFVHGCFWHGHEGCRYYVIPKTRTEWWQNKINRNKELDSQHVKSLKEQGWDVIVIRECELKQGIAESTLKNLIKKITR